MTVTQTISQLKEGRSEFEVALLRYPNGVELLAEIRKHCGIAPSESMGVSPSSASAWYAKGYALGILTEHTSGLPLISHHGSDLDPTALDVWLQEGKARRWISLDVL